MNKGRKETLTVRVVSVSFVILALAVFKPFGLSDWQWQAYLHLLVLWFLGIGSCMVTENILKFLVKMPRSTERGVNYIIRRNLWFQLINTPLISLIICVYRHFMLSDRVESNHLSWSNFLGTLVIIAFCSFAIGLYWRFKYRSRYLAAELEETRSLNEQLLKLQQDHAESVTEVPSQEAEHPSLPSSTVTLAGTTSETVTLQIPNLLYIEAVGNYVKVYQWLEGKIRTDMLRATSKQIEEDLSEYSMIVRCHRAFLVNLGQVEQIVSKSGTMQLHIKHCSESIPVSRSNMAGVKQAIKSI